MDTNKELVCKFEKELPAEGGTAEIEKLEAGECCLVKIPFQALQSGKYTIQAKVSYDQGTVEPLTINTEVGSTIEAALNLGVVMIAYTLTRLSLNFTLDDNKTS